MQSEPQSPVPSAQTSPPALALETRPEGVLLPVRAQPGAKRAALRGTHGGALKVAVTQVAEKGKANQALIALLAKQLGLSKSQLELISGHTSPDKQFVVRDVEQSELARRIATALKTIAE